MSMLSAQRYELHKCADTLQDAIDNLCLGRITYEGLTDALHYGINDLRSAANVISELSNQLADVIVSMGRVEERCAKLRRERDHWHVEQVHAYSNWEDAHKRVSELEAEKDKLLKIVSCLLTCANDTGDCDRCPINGGTGDWDSGDLCDGLLDCLRELGVEV